MALVNFKGQKKRVGLDPELLISTASFVVIDTELTGLNERKDSIVSIGAVRMNGGTISVGEPFYRLVRPAAKLTRESVVIHGITPSEVAEEREPASVLSEFTAFCNNDILVGHCVGIDLEFLDREMKRAHGEPLRNQVVDTAGLFAWMTKRGLTERCMASPPRVPDLYQLARWLDIEVAETHHALVDAFITAQLLQRFLPLLQEEGITRIGDLFRIADLFKGGDHFRSAGEIANL